MKKALYLDADDTIWKVYPGGIASICKPPYERVDDNVIKGRISADEFLPYGLDDLCYIALKDGARELIEYTREQNMDVVLVSANDPQPVEEAIKALDLEFDRTYVGWFKKGKIDVIKRDMAKHGISEGVYIDDNALVEVLAYCKDHPSDCKKVGNNITVEDLEIYDDIYDYIWDIYVEKVLKEEKY